MWKGGVIADDEDIQTKLENGKRRIEERERERKVLLADLQQLYLSQIDKELTQAQSYEII